MAVLIPYIDQVMQDAKRDMLFVEFKIDSAAPDELEQAIDRHVAWFEAAGLRFEPAAPREWMEGTPGIYVAYFDSLGDPRAVAYSAAFEVIQGESKYPEVYEMFVIPYSEWLVSGGPEYLRDQEEC
jgi:hypothetical protein